MSFAVECSYKIPECIYGASEFDGISWVEDVMQFTTKYCGSFYLKYNFMAIIEKYKLCI